MAGFRAREQIDRPPEEVFEYVTSLDNAPTWLPAVTRVEVITDGPVSVGTRFRETRVARGREGQAEMEVTAYDPPHRYSTVFADGDYEANYHYSFKAEDSGTQVELECVVGGRGLKKLMVPIVAWAMKRQDENQLKSLKAAMEGDG